MNIFFYIIIFIIGTLFGSFYTLAVYRIPKRQDILYTHSYCPNCNHKLGLLDLFPIFSYIFLRGKCRYCKNKIRPRYLILEILSGILFVTISYLIGMNINHLTSIKIVEFSFLVLYLTFIILLSGIDKENRKIDKAVNIIFQTSRRLIVLHHILDPVRNLSYIIRMNRGESANSCR